MSSTHNLFKELNRSRSLVHAGKSVLDRTVSVSKEITNSVSEVSSNSTATWDSLMEGSTNNTAVNSGLVAALDSSTTPDLKSVENISESLSDDISHENYTDDAVAPILIHSAGSVRQRYRQLKKEEEQKEALKATRLKRNFNLRPSPKDFPYAVDPVHNCAEPVSEAVSLFDITIDNLNYSKVFSSIHYSANFNSIDLSLYYSQFCTDYTYKKNILDIVKECKRNSSTILLLSETVCNEDTRRESKQILKSIWMLTSSPSSFVCIPPILEVDGKMRMELIPN